MLWHVDALVLVLPFRKISRAAQLTNLNPHHHLSLHILVVTYMYCVIPENIHTSLPKGFFQRPPPPPLWKFQLSFIHFFKFFGLTETPTPQEIPIPSVGGSTDIFWNCTFRRAHGYGSMQFARSGQFQDLSLSSFMTTPPWMGLCFKTFCHHSLHDGMLFQDLL